MTDSEWVASSEFKLLWRGGFKGLGGAFTTAGQPAEKPRAYSEQKSCWVEFRQPVDGVRLVSVELPTSVQPLSLQLRVWTYQDADDLYERFASEPGFALSGAKLTRYTDQKPKSNWRSQLDDADIAIRGVRFVAPIVVSIQDAYSIAVVRAMVEAFCLYVAHTAGAPKANQLATNALIPGRDAVTGTTADSPTDGYSLIAPGESAVEELSPAAKDLRDIETDARFGSTGLPMKIVLANARLGQGGYRARMLAVWEHRCALTSCTIEQVLVASHARAWSDCEGTHDCLDEYNGLLLVANVDRLFDCGLISFDDEGRVLTQDGFDCEELVSQTQLRFVHERHRPYLAWHRARHGFGSSLSLRQ